MVGAVPWNAPAVGPHLPPQLGVDLSRRERAPALRLVMSMSAFVEVVKVVKVVTETRVYTAAFQNAASH